MAQDTQEPEELDAANEASELERLLAEEEAAATEIEGPFWKKALHHLKTNKKVMALAIGGAVILAGLAIGGYWWLNRTAVPVVEDESAPPVEEPSPAQPEKLNIYPLKPFFLPIRDGRKESGRFVHLTVNLMLSNQELDKDLDKVLPLLRQNIYGILQRKKPSELEKPTTQLEETLKREILTAANSLLLSGTGTVKDVLLTEFLITDS